MGIHEIPKAQEIPMCETKEILKKLENLVKDPQPSKQNPRTLIRSYGCKCEKKLEDPQSQHYCHLQKIRTTNQTPPQTFDIEKIQNTERELAKSTEEKDHGAKAETNKDGSAANCPKESKEKKEKTNKEAEESDEEGKKNIITVKKMCKLNEETPPEMKAVIKEGKLPQENEEVCIKDPKTGAFTCYTVQAGRVIKQITEPQPLPEEKKVEPHPILPIPKPSTNFELRGSKMLVGCTCLKRNGMQHDCLRKECQGKRECLKFPAPVCQPSGLAPPIIKISPITTAIGPECGPKKRFKIKKTEMETRKVLLNYARAQYYQWPPSSRVPCEYHKKPILYTRPLQRIADVQTDKELLDQYVKSVYLTDVQTNKDGHKDKPTEKEETRKGNSTESSMNKKEKDSTLKDKTDGTYRQKVEETLKKIEKDLNNMTANG